MTKYKGTQGDDTISGTNKKDNFDMSQGGNDTVRTGGGADHVYFGAAFTAGDVIDGTGKKHSSEALATVELNGDYSQGVVFGDKTMTKIATLQLDGGHDYSLTFDAATSVDAIDASALQASDTLIVDASRSGATSFLISGAGSTSYFGHGDVTLNSALDSARDRLIMTAGGTLTLNAGEAQPLTLGGSWISNFQTVVLNGGIFDFTAADGFVPAGQVTNFVLSSDHFRKTTFTFNGSAETDGSFSFSGFHLDGTRISGSQNGDSFQDCRGTLLGGKGDDVFLSCSGDIGSGRGNDTFTFCGGTLHLENSGNVTITYSGGTYFMGASLDASDVVNNSSGTLVLDGDYSAGVVTSGIRGSIGFQFTAGHSYDLTLQDPDGSKTQTMAADGSTLGAGDKLTFNAEAEKEGDFVITGGAGDDLLIGGQHLNTLIGGKGQDWLIGNIGNDRLTGGGGKDTLEGDGGNNLFRYDAVSDSTSIHYDTVVNFALTRDAFGVQARVTGVDAAVTGGLLDDSGAARIFDQQLAAAVDAAHLAAHHAVLFTPDSGNLAGEIFLIVDQNGTAGYQAGQDLVIHMTGSDVSQLNAGNFH